MVIKNIHRLSYFNIPNMAYNVRVNRINAAQASNFCIIHFVKSAAAVQIVTQLQLLSSYNYLRLRFKPQRMHFVPIIKSPTFWR